jgi:hypothetical protein
MKIKNPMIVRCVAGEHILVPSGEGMSRYGGVFVTTEIGAEIWKMLEQGLEKPAILEALLEEYDVDEATLTADCDRFLQRLLEHGLIEE